MNIWDITIKVFLGFVLLLLITKIIGKTQINQVTAFDFISALVLGELLGNAIYDKKIPIYYVFYTLFIWGFLLYLVEVLNQKFIKARSFLEGTPSIIINRGKINRAELKKNKININTLQKLLREKSIFSIREVEYAILETSGRLSVLLKSNYGTPTREDCNLSYKTVNLPVIFISDGVVLDKNLKNFGYDRKWLYAKLKEHNINSVKKVFYAEWKEDEGLYIETLD